jgi:hypothetical protein
MQQFTATPKAPDRSSGRRFQPPSPAASPSLQSRPRQLGLLSSRMLTTVSENKRQALRVLTYRRYMCYILTRIFAS